MNCTKWLGRAVACGAVAATLSTAAANAAIFTISTSDNPITPVMDNQGWWKPGVANATLFNDNYITDEANGVRDYFSFDLAGVTGNVTSARLEVRRYNTDTGATLQLFDVSTSAVDLAQRLTIDNAIYNDLGTGVSYGSFVAGSGLNVDIMSFTLNAAALVDINASLGVFFSIGGTSTDGSHFANSSSETGLTFGANNFVQQLVLETADVSDVPLPGALPLFAAGVGMMGLLGWRRRRIENRNKGAAAGCY